MAGWKLCFNSAINQTDLYSVLFILSTSDSNWGEKIFAHMSRNASNWMHATFNKQFTKCPVTFLIDFTITSGEKYGQVKGTKCPPNYNPWRDISSNPTWRVTLFLTLKNNPNTNANPKVTTRWFALRLSGHFVLFTKDEGASNYVHFWT